MTGRAAGVATSTSRVLVAAPPQRVWELVTDWPAHARWVPLTRVRRCPGPVGAVGERFSARTGIGPLAFEDPMEVVLWRPPAGARPGRCELVKRGRLVLGSASLVVRGVGGGCTAVEWEESVSLLSSRASRPLALPMRVAGGLLFTRALRAMRRELTPAAP